ncbi:ATP synthase I [Paenibacillus yonginensis]|uniref:ATP synthase I n=1 Tax=Paenibacillus yonginensis TaxID=1462996 RepID=A0A1B1N3X5_9BACL|nr:ATP synthase subunit I [Paenibacillus yonginensis]ANS76148.1 ATP synthase I [Paenibacillus yonginensis]
MNELTKYRVLVVRIVLIFAALCLLISVILPEHRAIAHGLILGSIVSCINVIHMAYKVRLIIEAAVLAAEGKGTKRRVGLGFGFRLATSILAIVIPLEFPHYFSELAVLASLVFAHFLLQILGIIFSIKEERLRDELARKEKAKQQQN